MKQKHLKNQAAILTATLLAVGCAIAAPGPSSSTSSQQPGQMTSELPAARQSLREIFANPDDWEVHLYTFPREIRTYAPLTAAMLREKGSDVHYQHLAGRQVVAAAIDAAAGSRTIAEDIYPIRYVRALVEFKNKNRDELVVLEGDAKVLVFSVERTVDGRKETLPSIAIREKDFHVLTRSFFEQSK